MLDTKQNITCNLSSEYSRTHPVPRVVFVSFATWKKLTATFFTGFVGLLQTTVLPLI